VVEALEFPVFIPSCANPDCTGGRDATAMRLDRIRKKSHLLANSLVILIWLIAIVVVACGGWLVGSDIVKRHLQPRVATQPQ